MYEQCNHAKLDTGMHSLCQPTRVSYVGCVQAPEGTEREQYKKGQHLKGTDAANAERVRAEMVSAVLTSTPRTSALSAHQDQCSSDTLLFLHAAPLTYRLPVVCQHMRA